MIFMTTTEVVAEVEDYNMPSSFIKIAGALMSGRPAGSAVAVGKKPSASRYKLRGTRWRLFR